MAESAQHLDGAWPMASINPSIVPALVDRRFALRSENLLSIGSSSGLGAGRDLSSAPAAVIRRAASVALQQDESSVTSTPPGRGVGAKLLSM